MKDTEYALITGASGGLGAEFAKLFAKDGIPLILVARRLEKLMALKDELEHEEGVEVIVIQMDLSEPDVASSLLKKCKDYKVAYLVNNAGYGYNADFLESDFKKQQNLLRLNVATLMETTYLFGNKMKELGHGWILNISSTAALAPGPHMATYFASKSYVLSLSEALHEEFIPYGITVTALLPGPTATDFEKNANMKDSAMFHSLPVSKANKVAYKGYKGLKKGKAVVYAGRVTHWMAFGSRFLPRRWMRKMIGKVNGSSKKEK